MADLDPQARAFLDELAATGAPPTHELSPEEARRGLKLQAARIAITEDVDEVRDLSIPGPHGEIALRIFRVAAGRPLPVLVYFHGGGWVTGDLDSHDGVCRSLANRTACAVASVDYRLAPEQPFPAAAEDCVTATRWIHDHAHEHDLDASRVAVGGDSAGGNLAAVVALDARFEGGPPLVFQVLVYPITDHDFSTLSYADNADGYSLTRASMRWYWDHYLPDEGGRSDPRASPMKAPELSGLPPALVITAEYDPLRDEGEAYAQRLQDAGVAVTCSRYEGMIHGFFRMTKLVDRSHDAIDECARSLRAAFERRPDRSGSIR
ncbi:MAG: alpha/beta hydrolase [Actinomycetota bacterium]